MVLVTFDMRLAFCFYFINMYYAMTLFLKNTVPMFRHPTLNRVNPLGPYTPIKFALSSFAGIIFIILVVPCEGHSDDHRRNRIHCNYH